MGVMTRGLNRALAAGLVTGLLAGNASAQFAGMFRDTALGPRDAMAAQEAGARLFDGRDPSVGEVVRWRNESSGASGEARILALEDAGSCAVVEHSLRADTAARVEVLRFRRCKDATGVWQPGVAQ